MLDALTRWKLESCVEALVDVFHDISADEDVLRYVDSIRHLGVICAVASNQQQSRAHYMSTNLGYAERFDHEFYSHAIGAVKPEADFFKAVLSRLALPAEEVLFIDDSVPNVESARSVGLNVEHFPSNAGHRRLARTLAKYGIEVA